MNTGKAPINLQGLRLKTGIIRLMSERVRCVFCHSCWVVGQGLCKMYRLASLIYTATYEKYFSWAKSTPSQKKRCSDKKETTLTSTSGQTASLYLEHAFTVKEPCFMRALAELTNCNANEKHLYE